MAASRPDISNPDGLSLIQAGKAPAWMTDRRTLAVIAALEAKGLAGCARFVGGCVRNTITGHPVADVDIATTLTPDAVIEALTAADQAAGQALSKITIADLLDQNPASLAAFAPRSSCPVAA